MLMAGKAARAFVGSSISLGSALQLFSNHPILTHRFSLLATQDNTEVHFKIKKTTQLKKLKQAYCDRQV